MFRNHLIQVALQLFLLLLDVIDHLLRMYRDLLLHGVAMRQKLRHLRRQRI